jgi:response regulator of citrate/malate metabolism
MFTVLIIEDDASLAKALQLQLRLLYSHCALCATAATLDEAKDMLHLYEPDIVISDIMLPGGTAIEALTLLMKSSIAMPFELIVMSAYNNYHEQALRLGARAYLTKPYTLEDLCHALDRACHYVHQARQAMMYRVLAEQKRTQEGVQEIVEQAAQAVARECTVYHSVESTPESVSSMLPKSRASTDITPSIIIAANADGEWSRVFVPGADGRPCKLLSRQRLGFWEERLVRRAPQDKISSYLRVHDAWVVNLLHVVRWRKHANKKDAIAILSCGMEIPVARTKKKVFLERWAYIRQAVVLSSLLLDKPDLVGMRCTREDGL